MLKIWVCVQVINYKEKIPSLAVFTHITYKPSEGEEKLYNVLMCTVSVLKDLCITLKVTTGWCCSSFVYILLLIFPIRPVWHDSVWMHHQQCIIGTLNKWDWYTYGLPFVWSPLGLLIYNPSSFLTKSENNQCAVQHNAGALITKGSSLFHTTTGLLQQLLSLLLKQMIYGCVAIMMRLSHYHIDSLPDGLSSLIASWPVDMYLFETPMGETNELDGPGLQLAWRNQLQEIFVAIFDN